MLVHFIIIIITIISTGLSCTNLFIKSTLSTMAKDSIVNLEFVIVYVETLTFLAK